VPKAIKKAKNAKRTLAKSKIHLKFAMTSALKFIRIAFWQKEPSPHCVECPIIVIELFLGVNCFTTHHDTFAMDILKDAE
jgi:hypothetical protein